MDTPLGAVPKGDINKLNQPCQLTATPLPCRAYPVLIGQIHYLVIQVSHVILGSPGKEWGEATTNNDGSTGGVRVMSLRQSPHPGTRSMCAEHAREMPHILCRGIENGYT